MKIDQYLQKKMYIVTIALENLFQAIQTTQETNHHITQIVE